MTAWRDEAKHYIDFIVRPDGEYVFLEVNQAGQFLSKPEATWNEGASNLALPRVSNPSDMIGESQSQR